MQRRDFIRLLGGVAAAWPVVARAQQGNRVRRIGMLMGYAEADPDTQARMAAFKSGLDQLGWKDDHNIQITFRFGVGEMDRHGTFPRTSEPPVWICQLVPEYPPRGLARRTRINRLFPRQRGKRDLLRWGR